MLRGCLPTESTTFVGRRNERDDLEAAVGAHRLVTITGAPGVGKTRLAVRVGKCHLNAGHPVAFCDLRQVSTADDLVTQLGRTLNVEFREGWGLRYQVECVGRALASRNACLVLLDNFDQLAGHALETVGTWLRRAPVTFLVTSRQVLRLPEETVFELGPLSLSSSGGPEEPSDAARLFFERAAAAAPHFGEPSGLDQVGAETHRTVAELVGLLEGNPLAIELAAAQLRRASVFELLSGLQSRSAEERPSRSRRSGSAGDVVRSSMFRSIDDSWTRLSPSERSVLMQVTVFRGGFTREAAEQVVDLGHISDAPSISEILARLRDASLIHIQSDADPTGALRYDLFEVIREFIDERMVPEQHEPLRRRHGEFFVRYGEEWTARLTSSRGPEARAVLRREHDNLRAATAWCLGGAAVSDEDVAVRMALVFATAVHGWAPALSRTPLTQALSVASRGAERDEVLARLLVARAAAYRDTDSRDAAEADLARAETLAPRLSSSLQGLVACERGILLWARGDHDKARPVLEATLAVAESAGDVRLEARVRRYLARVLAEVYLDRAAFDHHARAIAILDDIGDVCGATLARKTWCVHRVFFRRGDPGDELKTQIRHLHRFGEWLDEAQGLTGLGIYFEERGDLEAARECFVRAKELGAQTGMRLVEGHAHMRLANWFDDKGQASEARVSYARAIRVFDVVDDRRNAGLALVFLAGLSAREGDPESAAGHLQHARRLFLAVGDTGFGEVASLQEAQIDLAKSRRRHEEGDAAGAEKHRRDALERVREASRARKDHRNVVRLPLLQCSAEARYVARLIERELSRPTRPADLLKVWPSGAAFQLGDASPVWLRGRVARRVLWALAKQREQAPGTVLSVDDLLKIGWPNEKMLRSAGLARVREIIKRLRRTGMRPYLLTGDGGYLLDALVPLSLVSSTHEGSAGHETGPPDRVGIGPSPY